MVCVVTGGSGSGKSEYAENLAMTLGEKRVYIATMQVFGEEGQQRVTRHRNMRAGKRFVTVECPAGLERLVEEEYCRILDKSVVLLECMSNLTANEMFTVGGCAETVKHRILEGVKIVQQRCTHLVIVTNEVFSDGTEYDPETMEYIRCLGMVNAALTGMADQMIEVVCGIPVKIKG